MKDSTIEPEEEAVEPPRERQLRLFVPSNPLTERIGKEFFRSVPHRPGVYRMMDETGRIVYVGQSGDLRKRLTSYRSVHPDRDSRKLVRLVHAVARIQWEECSDADSARLRENELLRALRPKFNRVNTYPAAYFFMTLRVQDESVTVRLGREVGSLGEVFGAFKARARFGYAALVRTLWSIRHAPVEMDRFPRRLLVAGIAPNEAIIDFPEASSRSSAERVANELIRFLAGSSDGLLELLRGQLPQDVSVFQRRLHEADLETLEEFYRFGPRRNRLLSERFGLGRRLIREEELDDLLALRPIGEPPREA